MHTHILFSKFYSGVNLPFDAPFVSPKKFELPSIPAFTPLLPGAELLESVGAEASVLFRPDFIIA